MMNNRSRPSTSARPVAAAVFSIALVTVMAGCSTPWSSDSGGSAPLQTDTASAGSQLQHEPNSPQETYVNQAESGDLPVNPSPEVEQQEADIASNAATGKKPVKSEETEAKWSAELPQLRGLSIGATQESVIRAYGEPDDEYPIASGDEKLTIMEYKGFTFGIHQGIVSFIEVYGAKVSTGLDGLRIGDDMKTAIDKLGKPDRSTSYVLSYLAEDATLKLDLDPKTQQILSVKLFTSIA
jgi:hypothetical protein